MKPLKTELTLAMLLADPITQAVMQSDNITEADTACAFIEAQRAGDRRDAPDLATWQPARHPPYRRM